MTTYEKVERSPFHIAKNAKGKWTITLGKYIAHENEFETKEEAITKIQNKDWELLFNTISIITQIINNKLTI